MLDLGKLRIGIEVDSDGAKNELKGFSNDVDKAETGISGKMKGLGAKIGSFLKAGAVAAAAAIGAAFVKITKDAMKAYAKFEQLEGGVKKIFGEDAAKTVMENAQNAFKTAGISANEYMEQVTSFSASLIQSLDGDTQKAAQTADMAIQDMADNANTFGTEIGSIQNAYQGFAKQNYTMLDNLKLGYGGTKEEMQRLLDDAEKLSGVHYDMSNLDDVYNAIHVVQEEMNVTGTTAKEAMSTIEGSVNATKAAWENFLVGLGDENADMDKLISNLVSSATAALKNIVPRLGKVITSLIKTLANMAMKAVNGDMDSILKNIENAMDTWPDKLLSAVISAINFLADMAESDASSKLAKTAVNVASKIGSALIKAAPALVTALMRLVINLYVAQSKALYTAVVAIFNKIKAAVIQAWNAIRKAVSQKIKAAVDSGPIHTLISAIKSAMSWWSSLRAKLRNPIKAVVNFFKKGGGGGDDDHPSRIGIREVPYDGYRALLHRGETVLTAAETNQYKKAMNRLLSANEPTDEPQVTNNDNTVNYNFGNITVDVSKLQDITTVEQFIDMMVRAKQFA